MCLSWPRNLLLCFFFPVQLRRNSGTWTLKHCLLFQTLLAVGIMLKLDGKAPNSIFAVNLLITARCRASITNLKQIIFFAYVWLQIALVEVGILPKNGCLREYFPLEKVTLFWNEYKCQGLFLTLAKLQTELYCISSLIILEGYFL